MLKFNGFSVNRTIKMIFAEHPNNNAEKLELAKEPDSMVIF